MGCISNLDPFCYGGNVKKIVIITRRFMGFIIALGKTLYHIVFEKYYLQVSWVPHETWQQHITYNMTFYGPNITRHQNNSLNIMSFTVYITIFDKPKICCTDWCNSRISNGQYPIDTSQGICQKYSILTVVDITLFIDNWSTYILWRIN